MKTIWITLLLMFMTACTQADKTITSSKVITPTETSEFLKKENSPLVIDIRTPEEFKEGHIKGAKNIDFRAADFSQKIALLDRDKPYIIHCKSGGRSTTSLKFWQDLGFTKIHHLDAGFDGWKKAKLPVSH